MFEFNDDDLTANKRGQLSSRQKEWLGMTARGARSFLWTNASIAIGFMFFGMCLILVLYLQNERSRAALFATPLNLLVFPVIIVVVLGILALSIFLARRQAKKLESAVLSSVSGTVRHDYDSSGESGINTYYVIVDKKKFKFADDMSSVFKEGENYKVYYCGSGVYEFVMSYEHL